MITSQLRMPRSKILSNCLLHLSSTKLNYSNIECELLGVLFAITHFKHFMYGHTVHVITDHKPLVSLFKKSLVDASPRLTRMLMQLLDFTLDVSAR